MFTIDICKTEKVRTIKDATTRIGFYEKRYQRFWRVIKLFGFIPVFGWVICDQEI